MSKKIYDVNVGGVPSLFSTYLKALGEKLGDSFEVAPVAGFSKDLLKDAAAIAVNPVLSAEVFTHVSVVPTQVRSLEAVDSFFKDEGGWVCRIISFEAMRRLLVERAKEMDIRNPAFVIGDGVKARIAGSVLAHMGFSDIYLVSEDGQALDEMISKLSKSYIGIRFHSLVASELTMQALSASILVNTLDLTQDKALLNDLSYFNFMKREGMVLDYNLEGFDNHALLEEAERADLRLIDCAEMAAGMAQVWLENLGLSSKLQWTELVDIWKACCKNPPSV